MIPVYYIYSDSFGTPQPWLDELPSDVSVRILQKRESRDRGQSLAGLQVLKRGMWDLGFADFRLTELGFPSGEKPVCARAADFNISHSGELVACAFSKAGPVGLDIEKIRPVEIDRFELYLTAAEREWVAGDLHRFFTLWTRKESVVKAHGRGGLQQIRQVQLSGDTARFAAREWRLESVDLMPGYRASVATVAQGNRAVELREMPLEDLIPAR